ncbi:glycosyltransferase [Candidatus Enterococcus huntleyi]|uniref:glycosyltransferase n=1 Tax=Candidatus Enterococcus huntleyi TaxID=1857217 RepID=UPI00137B05A4|nr:glycosyltransferase [Enterococcus sp. JM4C]
MNKDQIRYSLKVAKERKEVSQASYRSLFLVFFILSILFVALWIIWTAYAISIGDLMAFRPYFAIIGSISASQYVFSLFDVPFHVEELPKKSLAVVIPVYNENPETLHLVIAALFEQTVLPADIHIINDGSSPDLDYSEAKTCLIEGAKRTNVHCTWTDQENGGKRAAQTVGFKKIRNTQDCVVVTVDSDAVLARNALEEGLKPFADEEVKSVAGLIVSRNVHASLLARFTETIFVANQQLVERACLSLFGTVAVNSGNLAFYTYDVIESALAHDYNNEKFGKAEVKFSDDSFLTLFAVLKGKTVDQLTSVAFADMPSKLSHHIRQQIRWSRGSFIRGFWRIRYTPVFSMIFMRQFFGWFTFFINTCIFIQIVLSALSRGVFPALPFILIPMLFGYIQSTRYMIIRREDFSWKDHLIIWLLTPLSTLWSFLVLRFVKLYSMATCKKTGWGTRNVVEVIVDEPEQDAEDLPLEFGIESIEQADEPQEVIDLSLPAED